MIRARRGGVKLTFDLRFLKSLLNHSPTALLQSIAVKTLPFSPDPGFDLFKRFRFGGRTREDAASISPPPFFFPDLTPLALFSLPFAYSHTFLK